MSKNDDMTPEERQKYIDWGLDPDGPPKNRARAGCVSVRTPETMAGIGS